jgi:amino acid permease
MKAEPLSSFALGCFVVNVIMGAGFLGIPYGFAASGLLLGPLALAGVTLLQFAAACQLTECCARTHALLAGGGDSLIPLITIPSHTSYEILLLCRLLLGRTAELTVLGLLVLYVTGALWSFASVFASALAGAIALPIPGSTGPCDIYVDGDACLPLYRGWLAVFSSAMVVLCALDMREQVTLQVGMTCVRIVVILLMASSVVLSDRSAFHVPTDAAAAGAVPADAPVAAWEPAGLPTILPIAVYAQLFHVGIPALLQPLASKRNHARVFGVALTVTFLLYTTLGLATASHFGRSVDPSCNLHWRSFEPQMLGRAAATPTFSEVKLGLLRPHHVTGSR